MTTLMFFAPAIASFMDGQGLYNLSGVANEPVAEVTRAPEPEAAPQPEPQMTTASAAPQAPAKTTEAPKKDYSVKSAGSKAHLGEKLVNIKSCNSIQFITGMKGANQNKCDELKTAESFAGVLMEQLPICIQEGVAAKGINKPIKKSKVYNAGSLRTRTPPRGDLSLHYAARAIDIWNIDVFFEDGTSLKTPMNINSKNDAFYKKFNSCWERLTKERMKKKNSQCQRYDGVIDCADRDHRTHVHLSLPYCPKKSGYKSY